MTIQLTMAFDDVLPSLIRQVDFVSISILNFIAHEQTP
jgi:hypothetical protein